MKDGICFREEPGESVVAVNCVHNIRCSGQLLRHDCLDNTDISACGNC